MGLDFSKTALIVIDVQNDFCPAYRGKSGKDHPAGALAVKNGASVAAPLKALADFFAKNGGKVIASQDWHPENHVSFAASHKGRKPGEVISLPVSDAAAGAFAEAYPDLTGDAPREIEQVLWPVHCVQGTEGAAFHEGLETVHFDLIVRKGSRKDLDSYSAFFENDRLSPTELHSSLKAFSIDTLVIGGLATDYCVFYSAMDSIRLGYKTVLVSDAVAGVNFPEGSVEKALKAMKEAGVLFAASGELMEAARP